MFVILVRQNTKSNLETRWHAIEANKKRLPVFQIKYFKKILEVFQVDKMKGPRDHKMNWEVKHCHDPE